MFTQTIPGAGGAVAVVVCGGRAEAPWTGGAVRLADEGEPTVTRGVISSICRLETPARDRSATDEYRRPAMIFSAVTLPIPGKVARSFAEAVFRSIRDCVAGVVAGCCEKARLDSRSVIANKREACGFFMEVSSALWMRRNAKHFPVAPCVSVT